MQTRIVIWWPVAAALAVSLLWAGYLIGREASAPEWTARIDPVIRPYQGPPIWIDHDHRAHEYSGPTRVPCSGDDMKRVTSDSEQHMAASPDECELLCGSGACWSHPFPDRHLGVCLCDPAETPRTDAESETGERKVWWL